MRYLSSWTASPPWPQVWALLRRRQLGALCLPPAMAAVEAPGTPRRLGSVHVCMELWVWASEGHAQGLQGPLLRPPPHPEGAGPHLE